LEKYDNSMMKTAYIWAQESYCRRRQVGAVLAKEGRILSIGYNGTVAGSKSNNCEDEIITEIFKCSKCGSTTHHNGKCSMCDNNYMIFSHKEKTLVSKQTVLHAESNTLAFAAKNGIATNGCDLYVTLSPCVECSKLIIQHGIKRVIYDIEYRVTDGLDFLKSHGVKVVKMKGKNG